MGKAKRAAAQQAAAVKKKARMGQLILLGIVLAAFVGAYMLWNQGSQGGKSTLGNLRDRITLIATPRVPRPVALDPIYFTDPDVRQSYQTAKSDPETLEHMPCYCGCFDNSGHQNNLDCFADNHGAS